MSQLSVIIPTYNYAERLPRAISSVLKLPYSVELIIVDDGSTDSTAQVVSDIVDRGVELHFIQQENSGPAAARNRGVAKASSEFLLFLDADDELYLDGAVKAVECIKKSPSCDVLITGHFSSDSSGKKYHSLGAFSDSKEENFKCYLIDKHLKMSSGSMILRSSAVKQFKFPDFRNSEDIPYFAKLLALLDCQSLDEPTVIVNKHADSLRHDVDFADSVGEDIVDTIFSDPAMPAWVSKYEQLYRSRRCLSLFRTYYLSRDYETALRFYRKAVKLNPICILKISYLKKALAAKMSRSGC